MGTIQNAEELVIIFVLLSLNVFASGAEPSIRGVGFLPTDSGATGFSHVDGLSNDGSVAVGGSITGSGGSNTAFEWTASNGITSLGFLGGDFPFSEAAAVSAQGGVIVGRASLRPDASWLAFRWTPSEGMSTIGDLPGGRFEGRATGVSADGTIIVGRSSSDLSGASFSSTEAFQHSDAGGIIGLGDLTGGVFDSAAHAISADGNVIVGYGFSSAGREAMRWTESGGMVGLGDLPGGEHRSEALGASADGSVIVGHGSSADSAPSSPAFEAFRWTESEGMIGLGDLPGGRFTSTASAVTADGSVIVGWSEAGGITIDEAFIWDEDQGMRTLASYLENDIDLDLGGWMLDQAIRISDDGSTIVGWGRNPEGRVEGWVVAIPEPTSASLLFVGGLLICTFRRRCFGRKWGYVQVLTGESLLAPRRRG